MRNLRIVTALMLMAGLSACAAPDVASRNVGGAGFTFATQNSNGAILAPHYAIKDIRILVPKTLTVSEANTFLPNSDIVWHGDPEGDRYAQITAIFDTAAHRATADMTVGRAVVVDIVVTGFHAVTDKTRATFGGNHNMRFDLTVLDAETGEILDGPRRIIGDIHASGGAKARAEDAAGRTQKVVVTERLTEVIRRELSVPIDPSLVSRGTQAPLLVAPPQS